MASRPNLLVILTDMQRADTIGALGNPVIRTPQLDRLVREGTAYSSCYSPSPVCVPARCSMHYGLYPQKTGVTDNGSMMDDNGRSWPAVLAARGGYRTHAVGKCHFTPDAQALRGFHSRQSQEEVTSDPTRDDYVAWLAQNGYDYYEPHGARGEMYYIPQVSTLPAEAHPSHWIGSQSARFIRETGRTGRRQPWCLFSSFIHPHPPFAPPKPWHKLYRAPDMPLPFVPEQSPQLLTWINRLQNRYKYRDRGSDLNLLRTIRAYYYATISFVDYQIGRILEALEETGQLDDTLILFTSDHGEYLGDYGCFGKRSMHDVSARVPMIVRYPGRFAAGQRAASPASLVDVFPTLLGAADVSCDGLELDGIDLARLAAGEAAERTVYSQFAQGDRAIFMAANQAWKYVYSTGERKELLFDRRNDPLETTNLAAQAPEPGSQMKQNLLCYLACAGSGDAYVRRNGSGALEWQEFAPVDESSLQDPDAHLGFQDYPSYELDLPGYSR